MRLPWQQRFHDKSSDSDGHWCFSAGKCVCNNNYLPATPEYGLLVWVQVMVLRLPATLLSATVVWRDKHDCYHQLSSHRWPVKVPLCHVGPRGHILALGCQRWWAVWIPAASSPAAPWCLTALTDQKRAAQEWALGSGGSSSPTL